MIFNNNDNSEEMPSSLLHTEEIIEIDMGRPPRPPTAKTERDIINMLSGGKPQDNLKEEKGHNISKES